MGLSFGVPHLARRSDHGWHGGVDDDVTWDVKVRDSLVRIHHRERWTVVVDSLDVGFDFGFLVCWQGLDTRDEVSESVLEVDAELVKGLAVLFKEIFEEDADGVAKDDGVRDLHHCGFHVQ